LEHPHSPTRARPAHRWSLLLGLLALFLALPAPPPAAAEEPRFLIEKITVTGTRRSGSARIVVSESLLEEGRTYSEDDLRGAIHRIKRLPFVVDADFALRKGSARGRYELAVTVEETGAVFTSAVTEIDLGEEPLVPEEVRSPRHFDFGDRAVVGARQYVGAAGLLFAAVGGANGANDLVQVGYTRYNLFGPGSFASIALGFGPNGNSPTPALSAGLPLTANQALRATVSRSKLRANDEEQRSAELDWLYNTTDDLYFSTRGAALEADFVYRGYRSTFQPFAGPRQRFDERDQTFAFSGRHHRPLTARQSLSLGYTGALDRITGSRFFFSGPPPAPTSLYRATVDLKHSFDLLQGGSGSGRGDLRLETSIVGAVFDHPSDGESVYGSPGRQLTLRTGLVYRNPWVVARLGFNFNGKVMR
jgi:hypothetical protein